MRKLVYINTILLYTASHISVFANHSTSHQAHVSCHILFFTFFSVSHQFHQLFFLSSLSSKSIHFSFIYLFCNLILIHSLFITTYFFHWSFSFIFNPLSFLSQSFFCLINKKLAFIT